MDLAFCVGCKHSVGAAEPALAVTEILYLAPPGVELNRRPKSRNSLAQIFAFSFALTRASIGRLIELKLKVPVLEALGASSHWTHSAGQMLDASAL